MECRGQHLKNCVPLLHVSILHGYINSMRYLKDKVYKQKNPNTFLNKTNILIVAKNKKGTSKTGNIARIFFEKYIETADNSNISSMCIKKVGIVLQILNCNLLIDVEKFEVLCRHT